MSTPSRPYPDTPPSVRFGVDRVLELPSLLPRATRIGMVTNQAARLATDASVPSRVALLDAGVPIVRLFSPEHGLGAAASDGAPVANDTDPATGLPVVSLYGERFAPPPETLRDLDYVLFDIPDVGARFYTYIWTLSWVLEACTWTGTPLIILDRPNPLGGALEHAEGPMLDEIACSSFIGRWSIPIRHSLTVGELAVYWVRTRLPGARVQVVGCEGWRRRAMWPELGLPWVPTSPAMPVFESVMFYPGTCLFEGTNVSVGRGTEHPFQLIAAPWLDTQALLRVVHNVCRDAVRARGDTVTPTAGPYTGETCQALRLEMADLPQIRPVALGLGLVAAVVRNHGREFDWGGYPTAANPTGDEHFERLVGRRYVRGRMTERDAWIAAPTIARWTSVRAWRDSAGSSLLYD